MHVTLPPPPPPLPNTHTPSLYTQFIHPHPCSGTIMDSCCHHRTTQWLQIPQLKPISDWFSLLHHHLHNVRPHDHVRTHRPLSLPR